MRPIEERKSRAQKRVLAWLEQIAGKKLEWDSLPEEIRAKFEPYLDEYAMEEVAARAKLRWTSDSPPSHPYGARLDGQLFKGDGRIAVVELEARNPKQVRGALLDLMSYPNSKKLLIIGVSEVVIDAAEVKRQIKEQIVPLLREKFSLNDDIGIFTERELREGPTAFFQFLALDIA